MNRLLPLLIALAGACELTAARSKPNIVFILADDLGWADTSLYGHTRLYKTPNIERLAKRGMTFSRAYTASPLCSPTRSSILTGLSPARTGLTAPNCHLPQVVLQATEGTKAAPNQKSIGPTPVTRLDPKYHTLGEALKDAGYATGHFGKWHLGKEPYSPLEHGFDADVPHWPGPGPAGSFVAPWKFPDFDPDTPTQHIEDRMAKEAVAFLKRHKDEPFFLNYWMFSVHAPFDAKKDLIEKYRTRVDPKDPQRSPTYAAMVESMDDAVGTLIDTLDRLQLSENTIVIFFSDNGGNMYNTVDDTTPTSNAPLRGGKASMYEGGVRVPLIVSWPGVVKPDTRSDSRVQSDDFYPTILDLLGLKPGEGQIFDGVSFLPALKGEPHRRAPSFTYFPHNPPAPDWMPPSVSVHDGDWKLIRIFHGGEGGAHRWKLFNLRADIGERQDLVAKEPARVKRMDEMIEEFLNRTGAVRPIANPKFNPALYRPELEGVGKIRAKAPAPKKGNGKGAPKKKAAKDEEFPGLQGWKARQAKYSVKDGAVNVTAAGATPFLGVASGVSGPAKVSFRIRSRKGGSGKIEWNPGGGTASSVAYHTSGGDWQTVAVDIPAKGPLGIFRVYVPAQSQAVEIDWIELQPKAGKGRRWEF